MNPYSAPNERAMSAGDARSLSKTLIMSTVCFIVALVGLATCGYMLLRHPDYVDASLAAMEWPNNSPRVIAELTFVCFVLGVVLLVIEKIGRAEAALRSGR